MTFSGCSADVVPAAALAVRPDGHPSVAQIAACAVELVLSRCSFLDLNSK